MDIQFDVYQRSHHNPDASMPLLVPLHVLCNTPDAILHRHVQVNSARDDLEWVSEQPAHDGIAVMCGGGPSITDNLDNIRSLQAQGATIFAMNGASQFLNERGIPVDCQVMVDAKLATQTLVDNGAAEHLFASQVHPDTMERANNPRLWHLGIEDIEAHFPRARIEAGYSLFGGGASCGNCAMTLVYGMGYRTFHVFGYDSSHRGNDGHAYKQTMNDGIPVVETEWGGKTYVSQVAMRQQAEKFQITGFLLKQLGCEIVVHGDGLLPAMWNTPPEGLGERDKYRLMWRTASYRELSPGERIVPLIVEQLKPDGLVIDFGCGTGRASVELAKRGHDVLLVDFADNCRDPDAMLLPFMEWDLTDPCPARALSGICCDVLEHIPPADVETVVKNIMTSVRRAFFQISTGLDVHGALIGTPLHLSINDASWWRDLFNRLGYAIEWEQSTPVEAQFVVSRF